MDKINQKLKEYIDKHILPINQHNDDGHSITHINYVLTRSLRFADMIADINYDMVYTIAVFHDIGHHIDKDKHELVSAQMLLDDQALKKFFSQEQLKIMAEAIIDHRANMKYQPRSIYGKIVASADRDTCIETTLKRTHFYNMRHNSQYDLEMMIEDSRKEILDRFSTDGYARKSIYFVDLEFEKFANEITDLANNKEKFFKEYILVNKIDK